MKLYAYLQKFSMPNGEKTFELEVLMYSPQDDLEEQAQIFSTPLGSISITKYTRVPSEDKEIELK